MKSYLSKISKKVEKNKLVILPSITLCLAALIAILRASDVCAAVPTGAVDLPFMTALKETLKATIQGTGSYIIDAVAIVVGGFMTAKTSSPAPLILAVVSALIFEICVKIFVH